jgi:hypothetical protein
MIKNAISSAGNSKPDANAANAAKRTDTNMDLSKATDQEKKDILSVLQTEAKIRELKENPKAVDKQDLSDLQERLKKLEEELEKK